MLANKWCASGLEHIQLTPPVRGGHRGPFPGNNGTVVESVTESIIAVAVTDTATVEVGTVTVTEKETGTETGSTAATITNADDVAKIEKKKVARVTATAIEMKRIIENGEERGRMTQRTLLTQRGKEVMMYLMYPMLHTVPILEIQKEGTQNIRKSVTAYARTHVSLWNYLRRARLGKFLADALKLITDQALRSPPSPGFEQPPEDYNPEEPKEDDSETRSVFVSQLAARLTARDLGYFFEDKLGEGAVLDSRIVTDRISRRSKGYDEHAHKLGIPLTPVTASVTSNSEQWNSSRKHLI